MNRAAPPDWLRPDWTAPGVGALMSTRAGGVSAGAHATLNLKPDVGDDPAAVAENRARFAAALGGTPVWLEQVHGVRVVRLDRSHAAPGAAPPVADASVCTEPGLACTVQVADCLPVLFAAPQARGVAAAHAGWRGLAGGVLEATLASLCDAAGCAPEQVQAWLGACIGPGRFEVGADVLRAFPGADPARFSAFRPGKWLADLPGLARDRLRAAGVTAISGGGWCTVDDPSRFFSFRRDPVTGRMAAAVWIDDLR